MEGALLDSMKEKKRSFFVPNEIVYLIFLELPVKILLKFKCVCKEWICIMQDLEFVNSHRVRSYERSKGIGVLEISLKRNVLDLFIVDPEDPEDTDEDSEPTKVPFSCPLRGTPGAIEGLVCFENFVVNPSTKEVIELPDEEWNWGCDGCSLYYIGFGAHSKTYKILTLRRISKGVLLQGRVLTLGTIDSDSNSWRNVIIPEGWVEYFPSLFIHTHLSVNNKIFFLISLDHDDYYYRREKWSLFIFGVEEERFIGVLKEIPWDQGVDFNLLEVNGRLAMMDELTKVLWILEDYHLNGNGIGNGTWIKKNIIFPEALTHNVTFPVCTIHSSGTTYILFKACKDIRTQTFFYFYYNLTTNDIRVTSGADCANFRSFKHVETMFQLKPRPQPTARIC